MVKLFVDIFAFLSSMIMYTNNPFKIVGILFIGFTLLRYVYKNLFCPEVNGRHPYKTGELPSGSFKRKQLDMFRAKKGHFPKPFPDGWYKICNSKELKNGKVLTVSCLGREFVVFRSETGKAGVVDAFCPHMGTHLGHGGIVKGDNLVCPYHHWEFNTEGKNKKIPYCKKDMSGSERVNLKNFTTYESETLEAIFFWFDAELSHEPRWELHPGLKEIEKEITDGKMYRACETRWPDMLMHVFEPSQNSADYFHFKTVHKYLPMPFNLKLVEADHIVTSVYGRDDTPELDSSCLMIREKLGYLRLFGLSWLTLPSFIPNSLITYVHIQGPNNVIFKVDSVFGNFRAHFSLLPLDAFHQKAEQVMYCSSRTPRFFAKILHWWIDETVGQDRQVWENKIHCKPRNLVAGDGPFATYGKWLEKFYTEKSTSWEEYLTGRSSLEW